MRYCRLLSVVIICMIFNNNLFAQNLKVKVTTMGEPLGYSYVYINGDAKAVADSMGVAYIPMSWIEHGDTISASFVGHEGADAIFNSQAETTKVINIDLKNDFTLDEVVVGVSVSELYKKFIKKRRYSSWGIRYDMKFDITKQSNLVDSTSSGDISLLYSTNRLYYRDTNFKADGDTLMVIDFQGIDTLNIVDYIVSKHLLWGNELMAFDWMFREPNFDFWKCEVTFGYRGITDGYRLFTKTFHCSKFTLQIMYYFEKKGGKISHITSDGVWEDDKKTMKKLAAQFIITRKNRTFFISDLKYNIELYNNDIIDLHLYDITSEKAYWEKLNFDDTDKSVRKMKNYGY